jgi:hypothetical protein
MMFMFHFGKGDTFSLHADDKRDAIKRFQNFLPDTTFMLDDEYQSRRRADRERAIAIAAEAEAKKYEGELQAA